MSNYFCDLTNSPHFSGNSLKQLNIKVYQDYTVSPFFPRIKYLYAKEIDTIVQTRLNINVQSLITTQTQGRHRRSTIWLFGAITFNNRMTHFVLRIAQT